MAVLAASGELDLEDPVQDTLPSVAPVYGQSVSDREADRGKLGSVLDHVVPRVDLIVNTFGVRRLWSRG
jgi:CubicO group peptidase (beta-lactamase class C family)